MSASNYLELQLLDAAFGNDVGDLPVAAVYVKLHTDDPGEDCTGNPATETTRAAVTFDPAAAGVSTSATDAEWTNVSTGETYSHFSLWDNATVGNPLAYGELTAPVTVTAGDDFTIATGDLTVTLS